MELDILSVQVALAIAMFFILNWVGKHSASSGYITLTAFLQRDIAPAFNLLFRVIGPIVFVIVVASFFYSVGLDRYVFQIWLVVLYYYLVRLFFIVGFSRLRLVNWWREIFLWISSVGLGWLLYDYIIQDRTILLPEVKDLKNQFWILLILFIYAVFNTVQLNQEGTKQRKDNYIRRAYFKCKASYGEIVASLSVDPLSESLIYSILMFEQFNRPALVRLVERIVFPWGSRSLGPMQITTDRRITDNESVRLGAEHVVSIYKNVTNAGNQKAMSKNKSFDPITNRLHRQYVVRSVASAYNKDDDYVQGISEMHSKVIEDFYPNLKFSTVHWSEYLI